MCLKNFSRVGFRAGHGRTNALEVREQLILRELSTLGGVNEFESRLPQDSAWYGGVLVSSLPSCAGFWLTKTAFDEKGENYDFYDVNGMYH